MRRQVGPVLGLLLGAALAQPAIAQRSPAQPAFVIHEPRRNPVFPAALIPFTVGSEFCRRGHVPKVTFQVYNSLIVSVATVRLRQRGGLRLDSIPVPLRCGDYVATWDGTVDGGSRVAPPGVYWLNLSVDEKNTASKLVIAQP